MIMYFLIKKMKEHSIRIVIYYYQQQVNHLEIIHIDNADKISKIGDIELKISGGEKYIQQVLKSKMYIF